MVAGSDRAQTLRALEERLLDPRVRGSAQRVSDLLADDFAEIGSSGRVYDKKSVIEALQSDPGFQGTRTIVEFKERLLAPQIAQVVYRISETGTRRSSIWRVVGDRWELVFHQGTKPDD